MLRRPAVRLVVSLCSHHLRANVTRTVCALSHSQVEKLRESSWRKSTQATLDFQARSHCSAAPADKPSTATNGNGRRKEVSFEDLIELLNKGEVQLFDVRDPRELEEQGRIPGAVNIPLLDLKCALTGSEDEFIARFGCVKPTKTCTCVFHSAGKVKSSTALEIAHRLGLKNAKHYPGGWMEWSQKMGS